MKKYKVLLDADSFTSVTIEAEAFNVESGVLHFYKGTKECAAVWHWVYVKEEE